MTQSVRDKKLCVDMATEGCVSRVSPRYVSAQDESLERKGSDSDRRECRYRCRDSEIFGKPRSNSGRLGKAIAKASGTYRGNRQEQVLPDRMRCDKGRRHSEDVQMGGEGARWHRYFSEQRWNPHLKSYHSISLHENLMKFCGGRRGDKMNPESSVVESNSEECRNLIETNLIAPAIFAREAILSMKKRNAAGHIVNINSIAGLFAETLPISLGMYCPSKYGLRALGTELRHEIIMAKLNIKITNISPGPVDTDMIRNALPNVDTKSARMLQDIDVANAVVYTLGTPEGVEITEITLVPQNQNLGVPRDFPR
ncbi:PREDICTED: uncharacterized protein LOC108550850 [Eufriesea mexicana]|uniref:uncharacterized protein LOC108550850 n=1 Tax=Eufriesea mexicana TaxID=516756 RepID=UPI00083C480C|nr:PREDICTED: uncharacterized protein LOC108550850 [Eufriesea mexicana]